MNTDSEIESLIKQWKEESGPNSYSSEIFTSSAFKRLLSLREAVYPFILRELRDDSPWLGYQCLLKAISGEDFWQGEYMPKGFRSINVAESAKLWLEWGQLKGLISDIVPKWDRKTEYEPK